MGPGAIACSGYFRLDAGSNGITLRTTKLFSSLPARLARGRQKHEIQHAQAQAVTGLDGTAKPALWPVDESSKNQHVRVRSHTAVRPFTAAPYCLNPVRL